MTTKLNAKLPKAWRAKVDEVWYGPLKSTSKTIYSFTEAWRVQNILIKVLRKSPGVPEYADLAEALEQCGPNRRCRKKVCVLCGRARKLMLEAGSAPKADATLNVNSLATAVHGQEFC